ncbi:transposon Ty3-I Gag-Pol polyprotein [Trichonephila inaurata madagascariensis]|uniref:Transposon Ty3-I Gag-Pol polyprotein n=1 Tax=Trichonephila inaurata madagascariensis TaxID=2747483 RepID=A0A8X6XGK9_9ARAC|nr:transposon Ty3-I Gag-Pol polyprotein [Trichonephila inaurata madagascariensis]
MGHVITKAAVLRDSLDQGRYLLGNKTAALLEDYKTKEDVQMHMINAMQTRAQKKLLEVENEIQGQSIEQFDEELNDDLSEDEKKTIEEVLPVVKELSVQDLIKMSPKVFVVEQHKSEQLKPLIADAKLNVSKENKYVLEKNMLFFKKRDKNVTERKLLVVPEKFREQMKTFCHEDSDKTQVYHVNMMKPYFQREENINLLSLESSLIKEDEEIPKFELGIKNTKLSDIWMNIQSNTRLTADQKEKLSQLIKKYSRTFSIEPGCTNLTEHDIELESDRPICARPYRLSPRQSEILRAEVEKMLKLNVIEKGESDFTSLILVKAPKEEARPCIDYRWLKVTQTKFFPLPNIEELIETVSAAKYVSVLDLTRGYWQILLSKNAQRYAAFVTNFGTFKPLRLPFGLKNAPYDFSRLMASILKD